MKSFTKTYTAPVETLTLTYEEILATLFHNYCHIPLADLPDEVCEELVQFFVNNREFYALAYDGAQLNDSAKCHIPEILDDHKIPYIGGLPAEGIDIYNDYLYNKVEIHSETTSVRRLPYSHPEVQKFIEEAKGRYEEIKNNL